MQAIVFTKYGSPDDLELKEIPKPAPGDDEVLIKVHAASINSWDWELMKGKPFVNRIMFGLFKPKKINILGCDLAGQVEATGKNVKRFKPGDEVYGDQSSANWGGFAEYACAPENALELKPASMSFEQAAAIPQAALLALQGLRDQGQVRPGQKVLINGAGGGAGTFAIQIAKLYGAEVTGVDSTIKLDIMRSTGADHVVDYRQQDFTKHNERYDLIVDMAAYHGIFDYRRVLNPGGCFVMGGGSMALVYQLALLGFWFSRVGNKKMGLLLHKANKGLADINEMFEAGKLVPVIDRCYPLTEVADAMRYFGEGQARGKLVITFQ